MNCLRANCAGDVITKFSINNNLDREVNIFTDSFKGWGTDFSYFSNILNSAILLWLFITICWLGMPIGRWRCRVAIWRWCRVTINWWTRVAWQGGNQGGQGAEKGCKDLGGKT